ncbi:prophage tail gpP-like protein [Agrobacterium vitis]|nr:prophage tail gpP-like protein [Agrobacterium vitis]
MISLGNAAAQAITVTVGGKTYGGFTRVSASACLDKAARTFQLVVAGELNTVATARQFAAGTPVVLRCNGEVWLTGYVDSYRPRISGREASVSIAGRSKAADAIDSAVVDKTTGFQGKTPVEIAKALDKFGIGFKAVDAMEAVPRFHVTPGETVFQVVERLARDQGYTLRGLADGGIEFWNAKKTTKRQAGPLIQGLNILSADADHNWSRRHSHYHVRGQSAHGMDSHATEMQAVAKDGSVQRYRPTMINCENDTDIGRVRKRATHHRNTRAGRSLSANIEVVGYVDPGGKLWECGNLVYVESPFLNLQQDMLIEQVTIREDGGGMTTSLSLCDPAAYSGKKRKASKSGGEWAAENEEAE